MVQNLNEEDFKNLEAIIDLFNENFEENHLICRKWRAQFIEAMNINGDELTNVKPIDYLKHYLSFLWKVIILFD